MKQLIVAAVIIGIFMIFEQNTFAGDPKAKLHQGIHNTLHGWQEIPDNVTTLGQELNWFEGWTRGLALGFGRALARTGSGLYETVTFFIPVPEKHEPLMSPQ